MADLIVMIQSTGDGGTWNGVTVPYRVSVMIARNARLHFRRCICRAQAAATGGNIAPLQHLSKNVTYT